MSHGGRGEMTAQLPQTKPGFSWELWNFSGVYGPLYGVLIGLLCYRSLKQDE